MNVTYVFRATNRLARGLPQTDTERGTPPVEPESTLASGDTGFAATAHPAEPATAAPLLLGDPQENKRQTAASAAAIDVKPAARAVSVSAQLPTTYVAAEGRLILVAKARGGIGATTLAVNLALEMQMQAIKRGSATGGRVALVDLDVQLGNAGSFLDLADRGGMLALAQLGPEPVAQAVRHAMVRHPSGLGVFGGTHDGHTVRGI